MGTGKSNSDKRSKKLRFENKQGLWKTDEAKMVSAVDAEHQRTLVLWAISKSSLDDDQVTRITDRIKSITQREFPGVTSVSKVGNSSKEFIVYLSGTTGKTLSQEKASPDVLLEKLRVFGDKLDELHVQGIVHGDLRSDTLLFQEDGELTAAHFAVHHAIHDWSPNSRKLDPAIFGKYAPSMYYAPELRRGDDATAESDQYSLACIVLEVLLGRPLEPVETPLDAVDRLSKNYQGVAASLRKALSDAPEDRFSACWEFFESVTKQTKTKSKRRSRQPWKIVAAALLAPLLIAPTAKWLMAQSAQSRLDAEELTSLKEKYEIDVATPQENQIDASLAANMTSSSVYEQWYNQHVAQRDSAAKQQMQSVVDNWLRRWAAPMNVGVSLVSIADDERRVFLFSSNGSITDEGDPEQPLTVKIGALPVATSDLPDAKARLTVDVTGSKSVQQIVDLAPASNPAFDVKVMPPNGSWPVGSQISMSISVQVDEDSSWTSVSNRSLPVLQLGAVEWKRVLPTYLSVTRAVETKCTQSTSVSVAKGDKYRVEITGSVNIFSPDTIKKHKLPEKPDIGPSGVTAEQIEGRGYEYVTILGGSDHWGAAILKIGQNGPWMVPTTKTQPMIAAESGPIYVGINSIDHRRLKVTGKKTELFGDEGYWRRQGSFTIKIEHQQIELPPGTSSFVKSALIRNLQ